jgi:hypothetical protein
MARAAPIPAGGASTGTVAGLPAACAATAVARQPSAIPTAPPSAARVVASRTNWTATCRARAASARRSPISLPLQHRDHHDVRDADAADDQCDAAEREEQSDERRTRGESGHQNVRRPAHLDRLGRGWGCGQRQNRRNGADLVGVGTQVDAGRTGREAQLTVRQREADQRGVVDLWGHQATGTSRSASTTKVRATSSASSPTRSTTCSPGPTARSPRNGSSSPTPATSCARRSPSYAHPSTSSSVKPIRPRAELTAMGVDVRDDVDRTERLIDALLMLARSERPFHAEPLDLAALVEDAVYERAAAGLIWETSLAPAPVSGDPLLLERLAANLLDNATRYNVPAGTVAVATGTNAAGTFLRVANTGARCVDAASPRGRPGRHRRRQRRMGARLRPAGTWPGPADDDRLAGGAHRVGERPVLGLRVRARDGQLRSRVPRVRGRRTRLADVQSAEDRGRHRQRYRRRPGTPDELGREVAGLAHHLDAGGRADPP